MCKDYLNETVKKHINDFNKRIEEFLNDENFVFEDGCS